MFGLNRHLQVVEGEDLVSDVELIINIEPLTLRQQLSAVAGALHNSSAAHSGLLGEYAAGLLAIGSESDTMELTQAIETSSETVFSDLARFLFLTSLWDESKSARTPPRNLIRTYAVMAIRYLPAEPSIPSLTVPSLRSSILTRDLPWILSSETARGILRTMPPSGLATQTRSKVQAMASDGRLTSEERSALRVLAGILSAQ
jgi:hypothetical protein